MLFQSLGGEWVMQKQEDQVLMNKILVSFSRMKYKDKVALAAFAEASAKENPENLPILSLVVSRRDVA
jgi:hypothetical protein